MNIYLLFGKIYTDLLQVGNIPNELTLLGNVSDMLLKLQQPYNQSNTRKTKIYFLLPTIEKRVFQAYNTL